MPRLRSVRPIRPGSFLAAAAALLAVGATAADPDPSAGAGSAPASPAPAAAEGAGEPPLILFLESGGRRVPVEVDKPFPTHAVTNGEPAVLRLAPYREFRFQGLSFRYPREFTFDAEPGELGFMSWTFSGRDASLILNWFPGETDHRTLRRQVVKEFEEAIRTEDAESRPKRSKSTLEHARGHLDGERIVFSSLGVEMDQSSYSFRGGDGSFVLLIQDSEDDKGLPSAERRRVGQGLRETLALPPVSAPTKSPDRKPAAASRAGVEAPGGVPQG